MITDEVRVRGPHPQLVNDTGVLVVLVMHGIVRMAGRGMASTLAAQHGQLLRRTGGGEGAGRC